MNMLSHVGSSVWTVGKSLHHDASTVLFKNIPNDFAGRSWRDLSGLLGQLDRVSKWCVSLLKFIPVAARVSHLVTDSEGIQSALKPPLKSMTWIKEFSYSVLWINDIHQWMERKVVNGKSIVVFKLPTWDTRFNTLGNIFEALGFVQDHVYAFDIYGLLENRIGKLKDQFIFIACAIRLALYVKEYGMLTFKSSADTPKQAAEREKLLQPKIILSNALCALGKMAIIGLAPKHSMKDWFQVLTLLNDSGSLIGGVLKKRECLIG